MTRADERAQRRAARHYRAEILARDDFRCQIGKPGCNIIGNHIHPTKQIAACQPCLTPKKAT